MVILGAHVCYFSTIGARTVSATKRKCYFHDEKLLDYYTNYTRANCLMECAFKYTKGLCGCVPYFYPSKKYVVRGSKAIVKLSKKLRPFTLNTPWQFEFKDPENTVFLKLFGHQNSNL